MTFMEWLELHDLGLDRHRALLAEAAHERRVRLCLQDATMCGHGRGDTAEEAPIASMYQRQEANVVIGDGEAWCLRAGFTEREWRRLAFLRWLYRQGHLTA
jgi:hypothetical protein